MKNLSMQLVAILLVTVIAFGPMAQAMPTPIQETENAPNTVDPDVEALTQVAFAVWTAKLRADTADASDALDAYAAARDFFDHLDQIGMNNRIQRMILKNEERFINSGIATEEIHSQYVYATSRGIDIKESEFTNAMLISQNQARELLKTIRKIGMRGVEKNYLEHLRGVAHQLPVNNGFQRMHATVLFDGLNLSRAPHLQRVGVCAVAAALFALAAFFCPLLAIVAAAYALEDAMGWC
jgi:hypothetical protein